jgi:glycosyltransferase involved in cell wall biosynthesis
MTARPSISLLIPCYNGARYLEPLVAHIHAQVYAPDEVIIYDDGSTDDTVATAEALGIRCLVGEHNRGVAHARNRLAEAALGEWLHFTDVDDPIHPALLSTLAAEANASTDVVSCDADWRDEAGAIVRAWRYSGEELRLRPASHLLRNPMGLSNTLIRKTAWSEVAGCDERLAMWEDADVHFRLGRAGFRFTHISQPLGMSTRRQESFSHDYRHNWQCRLECLKHYVASALPADLEGAWLDELEITASSLIQYGDEEGAHAALRLAQSRGYRLPRTQQILAVALRRFVGDLELLKIQSRWRKFRSAKKA